MGLPPFKGIIRDGGSQEIHRRTAFKPYGKSSLNFEFTFLDNLLFLSDGRSEFIHQ